MQSCTTLMEAAIDVLQGQAKEEVEQKNEAVSDDNVSKAVEYIKKEFGISVRGSFPSDGKMHVLFEDKNYKIKDPTLAAFYTKFELKISAGGTEDGFIKVEMSSKYEHKGGGKNGASVTSTYEGGKWKDRSF